MKAFLYVLLAATLITGAFMTYKKYQMNKTIPDCKDHFDILKFELPSDKQALDNLIQFWADVSYPVRKNFVLKQLHIDYIFMSVLFPFVLVWCFRVRSRLQSLAKGKWDKVLIWALFIVGLLQLVAWTFDFYENCQLEQWIHAGKASDITLFKSLVIAKFVIFITGLILALYVSIKNCNKMEEKL